MRRLFPILLLTLSCAAKNIPIKHVVIIIKENRSFDNYFGTFPGANGATYGMAGSKRIPLGHAKLVSADQDHGWVASLEAMDNGKMDGFYKLAPHYRSYVQFHQADIRNYWKYAQTFALADNFFSSQYGASFPNHLYLGAADSDGIVDNPTKLEHRPAWGCDSVPGTTVTQVNPNNGHATKIFPCVDIPTLADELNTAGRTWRYYSATREEYGFTWSVFDAIRHIRYGDQWDTNVLNVNTFISDVQKGQLADVTWITPLGPVSDHPTQSVCDGENWSVQIINAIMQSQFWDSTEPTIATCLKVSNDSTGRSICISSHPACYHRRALLRSAARRDLFLQTLEQVRRRYGFAVVGYVVMPEHFHLLISEPEKGNPSVGMQVLKQRFASQVLQAWRARSQTAQGWRWNGMLEENHVWQRRFYDFVVWSEPKRVEKLRYMHRNPVKRGLVLEPDQWAWSSFAIMPTTSPARCW